MRLGRILLGLILLGGCAVTARADSEWLSAGEFHTCAVSAGNGVFCWGNNGNGQLGDGTQTQRTTAVPVTGLGSGIRAIATGSYHTCALTAAGAVLCWGANAYGQLGDGTTTDRTTPVPVSGLGSGVQAISAGGGQTCALTTAGAMKCWGFNGSGNLGDGTTTARHTPVQVTGLTGGVEAMAVGEAHACAISSGGALACWGNNDQGQLGDATYTARYTPTPVSGLDSGVSSIALGFYYSCAVGASGWAACWGSNDSGQLGYYGSANTPFLVSGLSSGIQAMAAGGFRTVGHTCALTTGGAVLCWGSNSFGEVGNGLVDYIWGEYDPVEVENLGGGVISIATGEYHSCALTAERTAVLCWGLNHLGQLGNGTAIYGPSPYAEPVLATGVFENVRLSIADASVPEGHAGVGLMAFSISLSSASARPVTFNIDSSNLSAAPGSDYENIDLVGQTIPAGETNKIITIPIHGDTVVESDETLMVGVTNIVGATPLRKEALGTIVNDEGTEPPLSIPRIPIAVGLQHSCALSAAGGAFCWGDNSYYQLGTEIAEVNPPHLAPAPVVGLDSGVRAITAGDYHTCALTTDGAVFCWGLNNDSQLGDGTTTNRSAPVPVRFLGSGVRAIAAAGSFTCAVTTSDAVVCWGDNSSGQLGDGTTRERATPRPVAGLNGGVRFVEAGGYARGDGGLSSHGHACALTLSGDVSCWGGNGNGQLGDGTTTRRFTPVQVSGLEAAVEAIAVGIYNSCAVSSTGAMKCWGGNSEGQLGDGTTTPNGIPTAVLGFGSGTRSIASGEIYSCAVDVDRAAWCWGLNLYGQLGDGSTTGSLVPVPVVGLTADADVIAAGVYHTCASTIAGRIWCWGNNSYGQLGDETTESRLTPVQVIGLVTAEPQPSLSIADVSISEGDTGTKTATFDLTLSTSAAVPVEFAISTADGTAVAGSDYVARTLTAQTIPAGSSVATFAVTVYGDATGESDETFSVVVSDVTGADVGDGTAIGTIVDDDGAPLPALVARADRIVLRENSVPLDISVLANDVLTASRLEGGSLEITVQPTRGTASVQAVGTATAADDRIRYTPSPDTGGLDSLSYRLCESNAARCTDASLQLVVRPMIDVDLAPAMNAGFVDLPMSGLRALPAAEFVATPAVAPAIVAAAITADPTPYFPFDSTAGRTTVLRTLPPADGAQPQDWQVLVDGRGSAGDIDLYVGLDTNADGVASASEVQCSAAMGSVVERCEIPASHPGDGVLRYWVVAHNRDDFAQTAHLQIFEVPMAPGDTRRVSTGPGILGSAEAFPLRVSWNDPGQAPGEARTGYVRVLNDGVETGRFPVRLDRDGDDVAAMALTPGRPQSLRLAAGAAQDRLFVDVPAGADAFTVTTSSTHNIDVYVARVDAPSSPAIDHAPARESADASAVSASGNESLTISGALLLPGRWYVTPVNAAAEVADLTVGVEVDGIAPEVRSGSFFNPARSGHGVFLYPAADQLTGLWYTYFQDGTPTWYYLQGPKPGANGIWSSAVYRSAWQGSANHLTAVGWVTLTPTGADAFSWSYELDGETGSEAMAALGRGCPRLDGAELDASSSWFNPERAGTGYSTQFWPDYEYYAAFVYDSRGVPRFLTAENSRFGGATAILDLEQLTGFCPLCARSGNPTRNTIGVMTRTFGAGTFQNITLDGIYVDGVPGAWTADESIQTLGGPGTTQSCVE